MPRTAETPAAAETYQPLAAFCTHCTTLASTARRNNPDARAPLGSALAARHHPKVQSAPHESEDERRAPAYSLPPARMRQTSAIIAPPNRTDGARSRVLETPTTPPLSRHFLCRPHRHHPQRHPDERPRTHFSARRLPGNAGAKRVFTHALRSSSPRPPTCSRPQPHTPVPACITSSPPSDTPWSVRPHAPPAAASGGTGTPSIRATPLAALVPVSHTPICTPFVPFSPASPYHSLSRPAASSGSGVPSSPSSQACELCGRARSVRGQTQSHFQSALKNARQYGATQRCGRGEEKRLLRTCNIQIIAIIKLGKRSPQLSGSPHRRPTRKEGTGNAR
ncbi:hypothetical protein DFH09DRAFT_1365558 [Mycena vulgaris]|nr:hypothetical protein DFH09DRAFT_1365558 [Mycena vulgaris]